MQLFNISLDTILIMGEKKKEQTEKQLSDEYISYLLRLFDNEDRRMNKLESKITQLIAQSGLIISIVTH